MLFSGIKGKNRSLLCTVITSVIVITITLVFVLVAIPLIVDAILKSYLQVQEGGEAWDRFVELPFPLDFKIYMFNVTNPKEIKEKGAKPILNEIGPYVYKNYRKKYDIKQEDNGYISFYQNQTFHFDKLATGSELSKTDRVTILNLIVVGVLQIVENSRASLPFSIDEVLPYVLDDSDLFAEIEVGKFLFEGIEFCNPERTSAEGKLVCLAVMLLNLKMVTYNDDLSMKYSLFAFKNNTNDGRYTLNTGVNNIKDIGKVTKWNDNPNMNIWSGEECNKVEGFEQTLYPPYFERDTSFKIFNTDFCRSVQLDFSKEVQYRDVNTYQFTLAKENFNVDESYDKSCYCSNFTRDMSGKFSCFLDGVQDIYPCLGIPGLVSYPHFLYADDHYLESVEGLEPREKDHYSYMNIQPLLGVPMSGFIGIQVNLIARPIYIMGEVVPSTENLEPFIAPVIWLQQGVEITEDYYSLLSNVVIILYWVEVAKWILAALISLCFIVRITWLTKGVLNGPKEKSTTPEPRISVASM